MSRPKLFRLSAFGLAMLGGAALSGCAPQQAAAPAPIAEQGPTDGTVTFTGGAVALGVGFQWGGGVLVYRGMQYPFRVSGLSVVDVGAARLSASGTVRNLRNVADFSGNYVSVSAGATLAGGASAAALRNQNGVVIEGISTSQGVRLTLAPGGVNITLTGR
jgi:hypothetical protein